MIGYIGTKCVFDNSENLQNSIYNNIGCAQDVQRNPLRGSISNFPVSLLLKNFFVKM